MRPIRSRRLGRGLLLPTLLALFLVSTWSVAQDVAALRFVHLSPDAPRVDVLADSLSLLRDVDYGSTTGFVRLTPGERTIRVFPHRLPEGSRDDGGEEEQEGDEEAAEPVRLEPVTLVAELEAGAYYTVVLSGFYEPPPDEERRGFLSIDVEPPEAELMLEGPRGFEHEASGDQLLRDLQPGEYTLRVDAGGYEPQTRIVTVRPFRTTVISATLQSEDAEEQNGDGGGDGADEEGEGEEGGEEEGEEEAGQAPAEANVDQEGETWDPLELHLFDEPEVALPPAGAARVRVIHASPLAPEVDVFFVREDDEPRDTLAEGVSFPNATAPSSVASGRGRLLVVVAGNRNPLYEVSDFMLEAGVVYSLYLTTSPEQNALTMVPTVSAVLRYHR